MGLLFLIVPSCSFQNLICGYITKNIFQTTVEENPLKHWISDLLISLPHNMLNAEDKTCGAPLMITSNIA